MALKLEVYAAVRKSRDTDREFVDLDTLGSTADQSKLRAFDKEERCKVEAGMNPKFAIEYPVVRIAYFSIREKGG